MQPNGSKSVSFNQQFVELLPRFVGIFCKRENFPTCTSTQERHGTLIWHHYIQIWMQHLSGWLGKFSQ